MSFASPQRPDDGSSPCDVPCSGRAHLVGIAGAGMQALARVLLDRGWCLTGSDQSDDVPAWLRAAGVKITSGHAEGNLSRGSQLLIYSDAVPASVPERRLAAQRGIPQFSYPQMLGQLMIGRCGVAVSGTHGKSTVTAMTGQILAETGFDPTIVGGGVPLDGDTGARAGHGEVMLAEACEYRSNFLNLLPQAAAILGIESDHFDCFPTLAHVEAAFEQFVQRLPSDGLLLAAHECPATTRVSRAAPCDVETFGLVPDADWQATELIEHFGRYQFAISYRGKDLGTVRLQTPGRHQVLNALAAAGLASAVGVPAERVIDALERFRGLQRRLEMLGDYQGITLVDDYAHHPTAVAATLATLRQMLPGRRLCCVFQPHQASRTRCLLDELAASLHNADVVAVADIYRAREPRAVAGEVTAADLAAEARRQGAMVLPSHPTNDILESFLEILRPGDVLVTMGAGDIGKMSHAFIDRLQRYRAAG